MNAVTDPKFFALFSGLLPEIGPRAWRKTYDFSAVASYSVDLFTETADGIINAVQSMFVDNASNNNALTITLLDTLQRIVIPARSQAVVPFFGSKVPTFTIATTQVDGMAAIPIYLINMPLPFLVWDADPSGAARINRVSLTDYSGAATGASVVVIAANANRKYLHVANQSGNSNSIYVNFGAAAVSTNSMEILPGGSLTMQIGGVSIQSVNILGTNLETYTCKEG